MKKIIISLIAGFFCFFIIYLIGAFSNNSLNISEWIAETRYAIAFFGFMAMLVGFLASIFHYDDI